MTIEIMTSEADDAELQSLRVQVMFAGFYEGAEVSDAVICRIAELLCKNAGAA